MENSSWFPLNVVDIQKLIPHRYPFLMVDKLIEIKEKEPGEVIGRVCKAQKNVTGNEYFFEGHFPNNPIMPGVLILEAIAQAGALCCCGMEKDSPIDQLFFAGVNNVRFKKPVIPGDVLDIHLEMKKKKSSFYFGTGIVYVGNKISTQADITAHITFKN